MVNQENKDGTAVQESPLWLAGSWPSGALWQTQSSNATTDTEAALSQAVHNTMLNPDEYMLVNDEFLNSFVQAWQSEAEFKGMNVVDTASSLTPSVASGEDVSQSKQAQPDSRVGVKGGTTKQTAAQLQAQRRYRVRQKQRVESLETEVVTLQARVVELENTVVQLQEQQPGSVQQQQLPDDSSAAQPDHQDPLIKESGEDESCDDMANCALLDVTTRGQQAMVEEHWRNVSVLRELLHGDASDSDLHNQICTLGKTCQAMVRSRGFSGINKLELVNDRSAMESYGVTADTAGGEMACYEELLAKVVNLQQPEVVARAQVWRSQFLHELEPIFDQRQALMAELVYTLPMRTNLNTMQMFEVHNSVDPGSETLEKLRVNLKEQQRLILNYVKTFFKDVVANPRDVARLTVFAADMQKCADPLALANIMLRDKLQSQVAMR